MKRWLGIGVMAALLVIGQGAFAAQSDPGVVDTSPVGQIMRDLNVPLLVAFLMLVTYTLWRELGATRQMYLDSLQKQIDYLRAVTPVTSTGARDPFVSTPVGINVSRDALASKSITRDQPS